MSGLENGVTDTIGVIAIDVTGGVSAVSMMAQGMPQSTLGFYEKYKQDGGAATGCALVAAPVRPTLGITRSARLMPTTNLENGSTLALSARW